MSRFFDPVTEVGGRTVTAELLHGAPPIAVTWNVTYSDGVAAGSTATGGLTHSVYMPEGRYTVTLRARRERRCTGGWGSPPWPGSRSAPGGSGAELVAGKGGKGNGGGVQAQAEACP